MLSSFCRWQDRVIRSWCGECGEHPKSGARDGLGTESACPHLPPWSHKDGPPSLIPFMHWLGGSDRRDINSPSPPPNCSEWLSHDFDFFLAGFFFIFGRKNIVFF